MYAKIKVDYEMLKKYESICESFKNKNHRGIPPYLYLNGNIFWCRSNYLKLMEKDVLKDFPCEQITITRQDK